MIDPNFTQEQWEFLWSLLYNVTTNNAFTRENGEVALNPERDDHAHVLDPLSLEEIVQFDDMQRKLWKALGREE